MGIIFRKLLLVVALFLFALFLIQCEGDSAKFDLRVFEATANTSSQVDDADKEEEDADDEDEDDKDRMLYFEIDRL